MGLQPFGCEAQRLMARGDLCEDIWGEKGEVEMAAEPATKDAITCCQLRHGLACGDLNVPETRLMDVAQEDRIDIAPRLTEDDPCFDAAALQREGIFPCEMRVIQYLWSDPEDLRQLDCVKCEPDPGRSEIEMCDEL